MSPGAVEAQITGDETHAYLLYLDTGQYAAITVHQRGGDVGLTLKDPEGNLLRSVDNPHGVQVPEPLPLVAERAGTYRVEVRLSDPKAPGGYEIRLDALRRSTPQDRTRVEAERLLALGEELRRRDDRSSRQKAVSAARSATRRFHELTEPDREADALYTLGSACYALDDQAGAMSSYEQALALFRQTGRELEAGKTLNAIGRVHRSQGEPELALERYREALLLNRRLKDRQQEATTLQNLGRAYQALGETEEALVHYEQALPIWRALKKTHDEAGTLLILGDLYKTMGEPQKALDFLPRALAIFETEGSLDDAAATLTALGDAQARAGDVRAAVASLNRALAIQRQIGDHRSEGHTLNNLGWCQSLLDRPGEARRSFAAALAIWRKVRDRPAEAVALSNVGWADVEQGRARAAIASFEKALPVLAASGNRDAEATAHLGLARSWRRLGDLTKARHAAEEALGRIESLRGNPASLSMRSSFLASKQEFYGFYVDLLMDLDSAQALGASEEARARSLLEMLGESGADLRKDVDPKLVERENELSRRINEADANRWRLSGEARTAAEANLRELLRQQDRAQAAIRRTSPGYAALTDPQPLALQEIRKEVADGETLLLEYYLGRERSFLWVVGPGSLDTFILPPRAKIEEAARRAYELLSASHQTLARRGADLALADLSRLLLQPAAKLLRGKRLVVVPDGALHYIPFAALKPENEIVTLPSVSSLSVLRREARPPAPAMLAVVADPVFDASDPRVSKNTPVKTVSLRGERLGRLPYSGQEAAALLALVPPADRLAALGFEASRETVLSGKLGRYRLVHFATHGILDTAHPELSGLLLSQIDRQGRPRDGFLRAHEVYRLSLPADLIVLSACRTALGAQIRGEGLVGLTRGFLHAGARGVLVSLWEVEDRATAELMHRFYSEMLVSERPPAAALRAAQASLRKEPGWEAPYFWAGFVLQGDWR